MSTTAIELSQKAQDMRLQLTRDGSYDFDGRRAWARVRADVCFGCVTQGGARPVTRARCC